MQVYKYCQKNKGFTLIEILASFVLLSIVILSFLSFFSQSMMFSVKVGDKLTAINVAERALNDLKMESLDDNRGYKYINDSTSLFNMNNKDYYIRHFELSTDENLELITLYVEIFVDDPALNPELTPETEVYGYREYERVE
ncbi:type II secretion system protein [Bacillaceae bacterium IKA-2]|nr:type II secretion system protein [Bacillaceae bacterium IKA-2]